MTYDAPRVAEAAFTGDLSQGMWRDAPWTAEFQDIEGPSRPAPRHKTRVKMMWDDRFLYIGAEMDEPDLWATYTEHDSVIFHENDFEVFLDPDGDNHDYFEYEINALGTDWDLRLPKPYRDGGPALNEWEIPGLRKKVTLRGTINDNTDTDDGWTVELAMPWSAFGDHGSPREMGVWRINFSRVQWDLLPYGKGYKKVEGRREHNWVWSPQWAIDMHRPELWGYVRFVPSPFATTRPFFDPLHEHKHRLMAVYHAQKRYRRFNGFWAKSIEALPGRWDNITMEQTEGGWIAESEGVTVRQDSKLGMRG